MGSRCCRDGSASREYETTKEEMFRENNAKSRDRVEKPVCELTPREAIEMMARLIGEGEVFVDGRARLRRQVTGNLESERNIRISIEETNLAISLHLKELEKNMISSIDEYDKLKVAESLPPVPEFSSSINQTMKSTYNNRGPFVFRLADYPGKDNPVELIKQQDGEAYYGQVSKQPDGSIIREGKGYFCLREDKVFAGYFHRDIFHGPGCLILNDGSYFRGVWVQGSPYGYGTYEWPDGRTYKGNWVKNLQEGYGEEYWDDGKSYYKGSFKGGQREGEGVLHLHDEGFTYKGQFRDNKLDGQGIYKWADGRVYEGEWRDDQMHGFGTFKFPDGRSYQGDYRFGKKEGYGTFKWTDGRIYKGYWRKGLQNGEGVFYEGGKQSKEMWIDGVKQVTHLPSQSEISGVASGVVTTYAKL